MKLAALLTAALLALPVAAHAADAPELLPVTSAAAGVQLTAVHCDQGADTDAAGSTVVGGTEVWLTADRCASLRHLLARDSAWLVRSPGGVANLDRAGDALQALVHEATHLRLASGDEGLVECTASRNYWPTVSAFHFSPKLAGRLLAASVASHRRLHDPRYRAVC
jgi:hypothetical protein